MRFSPPALSKSSTHSRSARKDSKASLNKRKAAASISGILAVLLALGGFFVLRPFFTNTSSSTSPHATSTSTILSEDIRKELQEYDFTELPLEIDGISVTASEFSYSLDKVRQSVISENLNQADQSSEAISISGDFFADASPDSPAAQAMEKAIEDVTHRHALYGIAAQSHLVTSDTWKGVLERLIQANKQREEDIQKGTPVYGLAAFDLSTFIEYETSGLEEAYITSDSLPGMNVGEQEIKRYYQEHSYTISDREGNSSAASLEEVRNNVIRELRQEIFYQLIEQQAQESTLSYDEAALRQWTADYLSQ